MSFDVRVKLWGNDIGIAFKQDGSDYVLFEYDKNFIRSGIELSPIVMPLSNKVYSFPALNFNSFKGLPGLLADSLPDKFGNAVINQWLAKQGRTEDSFSQMEKLSSREPSSISRISKSEKSCLSTESTHFSIVEAAL